MLWNTFANAGLNLVKCYMCTDQHVVQAVLFLHLCCMVISTFPFVKSFTYPHMEYFWSSQNLWYNHALAAHWGYIDFHKKCRIRDEFLPLHPFGPAMGSLHSEFPEEEHLDQRSCFISHLLACLPKTHTVLFCECSKLFNVSEMGYQFFCGLKHKICCFIQIKIK